MNFRYLLEDLLTELSGQEIYQKYYSKIPYGEFLQIVAADPKSLVVNDKIERMGKFAKLLISLYQKGGLQLEDLNKAEEYLGYVYKHTMSIDMNKIKSLSDLYDLVKQYIVQDTKSFDQVLNVLPKEEYKVLHNGEKWYIFQPLTEKASCYLGINTEWCTTWGPQSLDKKHQGRTSMFANYANKGPLYIMINKADPSYKFQFSFESSQYMDKNDRRIDKTSFFYDKDEIFNFFFPSFSKEVSPEQIKLEVKRIEILPDSEAMMLIRKSIGSTNNQLVEAILNEDIDSLRECIISDSVEEMEFGTSWRNGRLILQLTDLQMDLQDLQYIISSYQADADDGYEFLRNDLQDAGVDFAEEHLTEFFKKYYESNADEFRVGFGIKNYDQFYKMFYENYKGSEKIQDAFVDDAVELTIDNFQEAMRNRLKSITDILDVSYDYEVDVNIVPFVQFLVQRNIDKIDDEGGIDIFSLFESFIKYAKLPTEYEYTYDYQTVFPKFEMERSDLKKVTLEYFDDLLEKGDQTEECHKLRLQLNDILEKYFKGSDVYENEHYKIRIHNQSINCETGMVRVDFINKDTGEVIAGYNKKDGNVKVENLVSWMMNYKLFESKLSLMSLL